LTDFGKKKNKNSMQFLQPYDVLIIFNENKGMIVKDFFINMCACVLRVLMAIITSQ